MMQRVVCVGGPWDGEMLMVDVTSQTITFPLPASVSGSISAPGLSGDWGYGTAVPFRAVVYRRVDWQTFVYAEGENG